jgi:transcriptional regulator with XRE-family HTH domain
VSQRDILRFYRHVGRRIRTKRELTGLSQADLGEMVKLTRASISNIEGGNQRMLTHTLVDIAFALGVDAGEFLP